MKEQPVISRITIIPMPVSFDPTLPIHALLPEIERALAEALNLVLEAPPGAGKTSQVPLVPLDAPWRKGGKILVLEPRRLAARSAAQRLAFHLGEEVGETAGYRVRLDRRVGPKTVIECVTTGLFLRQIQADPGLSGIAALLFDEFHERGLDADLALALSIEAQQGLRPDLRLIVMSATLDGERVARLLPGSRRLASRGQSFPVETIHLGEDRAARLEQRMAGAIRRALAEGPGGGDILAFLPGLAEIRRTMNELENLGDVLVLPLHGDLPLADQELAIRKDPGGRRKVILSTSIAESSLTIAGVGVVIDSGLRRIARFDPSTGMTRLTNVKVALANADQRRGRAGRLGPGTCYRLWSKEAERALEPHPAPEIREADLAPMALELAVWGTGDVARLALLDPPPEAAFAQARQLLKALGAIDAANLATAHGKAMAELGLHPRLAHMLLVGRERGLGSLACDLAALLGERDLLAGSGLRDADLGKRLDLLLGSGKGAAARIRASADSWRRQLRIARDPNPARGAIGALIALAYPDRIAQRRGSAGQFRLSSGRGAELAATDALANHPFLAVAALDQGERNARIFLAAPITLAEIETDFAELIETAEDVSWNAREGIVAATRQRRLMALVLEEKPLARPDEEKLRRAMLDGIRQMGLGSLNWSREAVMLRARMAFLRRVDAANAASWPDWSDEALLATLDDWLGPHLDGISRKAHLAKLDLAEILLGCLSWKQRRALDEEAPTHLTVPSGSRVPLDYESGETPILAVRLQEMFGASETPRIANDSIAVLIHLLSPARRPVQVTRDLKSFWANAYKSVKADLKGQYPKHHWPDDPLIAAPTARAKPRTRR
jgi:ATP-dependent helicase HrpB